VNVRLAATPVRSSSRADAKRPSEQRRDRSEMSSWSCVGRRVQRVVAIMNAEPAGDGVSHRRPLALDRKTCRPIPTEITFAREGIERCGSNRPRASLDTPEGEWKSRPSQFP
jgi:hypothetical protein